MSGEENETSDQVAASAAAAVETEKNKQYKSNKNKHKGKKKGFSKPKQVTKKEHKGATKALNGHMFVDPSEDPTTRQDNYKRTVEAIETWHYASQNSPQDASSAFEDEPKVPSLPKPKKPKNPGPTVPSEPQMTLRSEEGK